MGYLVKLVTVVVAVLLWHLYHLDPNVAQLKDVLQLLHSETVHGHVAIGFIVALLLDDRFGAPIAYVSSRGSMSAIHTVERFDGCCGARGSNGFVRSEEK